MEFTKEQVSLCKQVVEGYRKPITFGTWYLNEEDDILLHNNRNIGELYEVYGETISPIPLWTISDFLIFLGDRALYLENLGQTDEFEYTCCIRETDDLGLLRHSPKEAEGETPLEACLKVVLAVLEEIQRVA